MITQTTSMLDQPAADMETPRCLCGATASVGRVIARDEVSGELFTYLRCAECGLVRLSPRPVLRAMGRYYPETYDAHARPVERPLSRGEWLKRLVFDVFFARPQERPEKLRRWRWLLVLALWPIHTHTVLAFPQPERRRAFEFGAATGNDLVEFRRAGWEVFGCEPSAQACAYAARRGFSLQCCNAEDAEPPSNLTCVYMNNVFEHLHDPRAVLATSRAALEPGGVVVLVVPNHASWAARLFGAAWPGYDPPKHIWGFTPKSMRRLLESSGFRVLTIRHVFPASNCCWHSGLHGGRAPTTPWPRARAVAARFVGRAIIPVGVLAAWFGHGDYIRVVAAKV